jgi:hypothetical protein
MPARLPPHPALIASRNATGENWKSNSDWHHRPTRLTTKPNPRPPSEVASLFLTLVEIQQLLQNGSTGLDALLAAVNLRVRFDAAQTLTVAEQLQARTNIGAVAASDVGNTDTDFVAIFDGVLA